MSDNLDVPRGAEERTRKYLERIRRGLRYRQRFLEIWQENRKACYGEDIAVLDDVARIDKLGAFLESRVAALALRNPRCKLTPRNESGWEPMEVPVIDPQTGPITDTVPDPMTGMPVEVPRMKRVPRFKVLENVVNYLLGRHDFRAAPNGRLCVKSALLSGLGCLKVGYTADYEYAGDEDYLPIPLEEALLMDAAWLKKHYEFADSGEPQIDSHNRLVPKGQIPISEQWFIDWLDTERMIFDPEGENDFFTHRWVAYECWRPLEEVKKDKRLKNTKDLKATGRADDVDPTLFVSDFDHFDPSDEDAKMVRLFEVWDFEKEMLLILAEGHAKPLRNDPIPEGVCPRTGPFAFYRPSEKPGEWYGHAPTTNLRKISAFYNDANRQAMAEMRKATTKILADSRFVQEQDMTRLNSPVKEIIRLDMDSAPQGATLEHAVSALKYPSTAPEMFQYARYIAENFDEIAGQPVQSRGGHTGGTATEVNAMTSREFLREEFQRGIYAETWRTVLKKLVDSIQTNMTIEQAITILDGDGLAWVGMITPDMIQGDFDVNIDVQDMEPLNKQMDRANLVNLLTIVGQAPFLAADDQAFEGMCELFGLHDKRIAKGIAQMAQMQMMALMTAKQPGKPGSSAPENEGDAIAQRGGGVMFGG